jgi:RNA polymerase-binding transcription factor DksA
MNHLALLAPNSELTGEELSTLRVLLLTERENQIAQLQQSRSTAAGLTGQSDVDSLLERELAIASADRATAALEDIDAALRDIELGAYGSCRNCGAAVPYSRLEVIPQTRSCVGCH